MPLTMIAPNGRGSASCHRSYWLVALGAAAGLAVHASAQVTQEVSDDGLLTTTIVPESTDNTGWTRGGATIFSTVADVEIHLRRQIGGLQVADMNGDGLLDVVAGVYHSSSFPPYDDWHDMVFYNTGTTLGATPSWVSTEQVHTGDVQLGDLNGDGSLEIVTIHGGVSSQSVRVYTGGAGGPSMTAGYVSSTPTPVWGTAGVLADIDGDLDLDLVTSNQGVSPNPFRPNYMFRNDGGTLTTAPTWESADQAVQNGVTAGDFNGDGWVDIAVAKWVNFESGIYYSDEGTLNTTPGWTVGHEETDKGAAVADLDDNGELDAVFGGDPSRAYGQSAGVFTQVWNNTDPFSGAQEIRTHDVDGDGDLDVADVHFSTGRCHVYLNNNGTVNNDPDWTFDASQVGNTLAFGDINGDGRDDLVVGYSGDICIRVFFAVAPACLVDLNDDDLLDFFDVQMFLNLYTAQDPAADFNDDGEFDFFDVQTFLNLYAAGCP